jgi:hypothetical protein
VTPRKAVRTIVPSRAPRHVALGPTNLRCQARFPYGCDGGGGVRSRAVPGIDRCRPALPSLRSDGTSPGSLSWLYESPATPDLPLLTPELPANQGVVCWRARFTNSHSSLGLVLSSMSGHTRDITPLLGISSARCPSLHILRNRTADKQTKQTYLYTLVPPSRPVNPVGETGVEQRTPGLKKLPYSVDSERKRPPND